MRHSPILAWDLVAVVRAGLGRGGGKDLEVNGGGQRKRWSLGGNIANGGGSQRTIVGPVMQDDPVVQDLKVSFESETFWL
jgi:hypothetical protein